ncbi:hypothetical protein ACSSS7_000475 [Eimeria intestinalis]
MAAVQTTIKTELCSFSECRIYPGRGQKFVARDGKVHTYISSKCARLGRQKLKPAKLRWTLGPCAAFCFKVWRRANKKSRGEAVAKRRTRKTTKVQKAIVGISLEEIKQRRAAKPDPTKVLSSSHIPPPVFSSFAALILIVINFNVILPRDSMRKMPSKESKKDKEKKEKTKPVVIPGTKAPPVRSIPKQKMGGSRLILPLEKDLFGWQQLRPPPVATVDRDYATQSSYSLLHRLSFRASRRACEGVVVGRQWLAAESAQFSPPETVCSSLFPCAFGEQKRLAHKFAAPECPNLLKLRSAIEQSFQPICFYAKNDYAMGHHVYDQHFYINAMVDRVLEPIGEQRLRNLQAHLPMSSSYGA